MNTLLKDLGRYLLKFCWIIIICALLGGVLGFVTKKPAGKQEEYSYTSSAKILIDIEEINKKFLDNSNGSGSGSSNQFETIENNVFSEYNLAYSLLPTFKEIFYSRNSVVARVVEDYNATVTEEKDKVNADLVCVLTQISVPSGSLSLDVTVTSKYEKRSRLLLELMCKYGVMKINEYSDLVKVKISDRDSFLSSVKVSGTEEELDEYKTKITQNYTKIYKDMKQSLTANEYIQLYHVESGFSFKKDGDDLVVSFESNYATCADFAIESIITDEFRGSVNVVADSKKNIESNVADIYTKKITATTETGAVNNTIILALFGAVGATLLLTFIFIVKNGYCEKTAVTEETTQAEEKKEE